MQVEVIETTGGNIFNQLLFSITIFNFIFNPTGYVRIDYLYSDTNHKMFKVVY